jgi:hypothetical protein
MRCAWSYESNSFEAAVPSRNSKAENSLHPWNQRIFTVRFNVVIVLPSGFTHHDPNDVGTGLYIELPVQRDCRIFLR